MEVNRFALGSLLFLGCREPSTAPPIVVRAADRLLLVSPSGYQTVSLLDGGRTGLYFDAAEDFLHGQPRIARVALLGVGGGEMLKAAHRAQPQAELIGVELDARTAGLAKHEFKAPGAIVVADALEWIHAQPPESLDVVMVDLYNDSVLVEAATQPAFLRDCARALRPFGLYIQNVWPEERAAEIETRAALHFVTGQKHYGHNVVITGMRKPDAP